MKVELIVGGQPVAGGSLPREFANRINETTTFVRLESTLPGSIWCAEGETVLVVKLTAGNLGVIDSDGQFVPDDDDTNSHLTPPKNT